VWRKPQKCVDRSRKTNGKRGTTEGTTQSGGRHQEDSAATEDRKIDGWAESKNFPLYSALGFPLVGTSHESRRRYLFGGLARFQISAGKYGDIE